MNFECDTKFCEFVYAHVFKYPTYVLHAADINECESMHEWESMLTIFILYKRFSSVSFFLLFCILFFLLAIVLYLVVRHQSLVTTS